MAANLDRYARFSADELNTLEMALTRLVRTDGASAVTDTLQSEIREIQNLRAVAPGDEYPESAEPIPDEGDESLGLAVCAS